MLNGWRRMNGVTLSIAAALTALAAGAVVSGASDAGQVAVRMAGASSGTPGGGASGGGGSAGGGNTARDGQIAIHEEYNVAIAKNTVASYEQFIARHPDNVLTVQARARLNALTKR